MKKSGLADSPFFAPRPPLPAPPPAKVVSSSANPKRAALESQRKSANKKPPLPPEEFVKPPGNRDTTLPRYRDTTPPRYHDTMVEAVRKAVKEFGKEAATHRFTAEEKKAIADIIYAYKGQGIRTSENVVARITFNFVVADYRENGKNSLLDRALKALNR